jgi:hypothetical protein
MKRTQRSPLYFLSIAIGTMAAIGAGSAIWFVATHRSSSTVSAEAADREFQQLRARFADQQPLLDMDQRQARTAVATATKIAHLRVVHTVIFDTRGGQRLVRIDVPYWFARTYGRHGSMQWLGQLSFLDDTEFDPEPIRLSWDQVERHGPGLIADYRHPSGGQFISWVE